MASSYGGEVVDTIEEFISLVDVARIATPTNTHRSIGEILLNNKKHVLIEKPIADTTDDAQALVNLAAEKGVFCRSDTLSVLIQCWDRLKRLKDGS